MGSGCVSSCLCCVFVSVVHPVAIMNAVFCVICSLLMFVSDASGDHIVETYSSMGLVMALYVAMIISFCFPHTVDVSALSICIIFCAFVVIYMCLLYVSLGSRVSPSIFWLMFMGSVMFYICSSSYVLYSAGSGVKRVQFSACIVCQVVRLYNVVEIVVMYGQVACCSVVCGTLVGALVFSIMCSELMIISVIS